MSENVGHCKYCGGDWFSHSGSCPTLDGAGLLAERDSLALQLQAAQAALAHVMAENTAKSELLTRIRQWDVVNQPPGGGDGAYWAAEIDALFAKLGAQEWGGDAERDTLASTVTRQRSEIDTARWWLDMEREITAEMHVEIGQAQKSREKAEAKLRKWEDWQPDDETMRAARAQATANRFSSRAANLVYVRALELAWRKTQAERDRYKVIVEEVAAKAALHPEPADAAPDA